MHERMSFKLTITCIILQTATLDLQDYIHDQQNYDLEAFTTKSVCFSIVYNIISQSGESATYDLDAWKSNALTPEINYDLADSRSAKILFYFEIKTILKRKSKTCQTLMKLFR